MLSECRDRKDDGLRDDPNPVGIAEEAHERQRLITGSENGINTPTVSNAATAMRWVHVGRIDDLGRVRDVEVRTSAHLRPA